MLNKETIKQIALANGFKLKEQANGEMDLNPYVYDTINKAIAFYESKKNDGWISVDDLPNDTNIKGSYLAYSIHTKFYERVHIEKLKVMINHSHPAKITHFKPLPNPPKE